MMRATGICVFAPVIEWLLPFNVLSSHLVFRGLNRDIQSLGVKFLSETQAVLYQSKERVEWGSGINCI